MGAALSPPPRACHADAVRTDRPDWASIAADGFRFPAATAPSDWAEELATALVSPDPVLRDEHAYTAAARWIERGHLDEVLQELGDGAAGRFTHPAVQARSFAPLLLRCVLARGQAAPGTVPQDAAERWYAAFASWYPAERDTRGWDDSLGWLHAVAHGADAAAAFAVTLPHHGTRILELCARRMTATDTAHRYEQLEDARLARALTRVLLTPGLTAHEATRWLAVIEEALEGGGPGPVPPWAFNTFATLQSLHLHLTLGLADQGIPPHAAPVAARTAAILRLPCGWLA